MAKTQKRNYNKSSKKNAKLSKKAKVRSTRKTSKKRTNKPKSLKRKKTHKMKGGADPVKFMVCLLPINPDLRLFPDIINTDEEKALINSILLEENVIKNNVAYTIKGINLTTRRNSANAFMEKYLKRKENYCANLKKNKKKKNPLCKVEDVSKELYPIPGMWNARMVVIPLDNESVYTKNVSELKLKEKLPSWEELFEKIPELAPPPPPRPSLDLDEKIIQFKKDMEILYVKSAEFEQFKAKVTAFKKDQSTLSINTTKQITDLLTNQDTMIEKIQELISLIEEIPNLPQSLKNSIKSINDGFFKLAKKLRPTGLLPP